MEAGQFAGPGFARPRRRARDRTWPRTGTTADRCRLVTVVGRRVRRWSEPRRRPLSIRWPADRGCSTEYLRPWSPVRWACP